MRLNNQQKGIALAFFGVLMITPDSLFIRLVNINSWDLVFYRGAIPFLCLLIGLLFVYKNKFLSAFYAIGLAGVLNAIFIALMNISFIVSIENTNVANTLIMISLAPMLSAIISFIFLKENPDKKTWMAITVTTLAVIYIFFDSLEKGDFKGNFFGFICATGLAAGTVIIRSVKQINLVPSAMMGKLFVALIALIFVDKFNLTGKDLIIIPTMGIFCVAIPFVLITLAPRYITAPEVNLFFLLETILGPLWVWLVIHEQPSIETIVVGVVIISTIAVHSFLALKKT